ncbi:MAG: NfeD family protein [Pirellulaceae bacterium]|nr:NfeD family protein [Pirellulaceae bacterium]
MLRSRQHGSSPVCGGFVVCAAVVCLAIVGAGPRLWGAEGDAGAGAEPVVQRFDVPLPITGLVDQQVKQQVERALRKLPAGGPRPVFIFEFHPKPATAGEGSEFGRALNLARFLSGEELAPVRTVAWLPQSVKGHAVLPVLACEQIVMQKDTELGAAGTDETAIDPTLQRGYSEIAERRRTIPPAIALGLLDKSVGVIKVTTPSGVRYELPDEVAKLREAGMVTKEETIFQPGDPHVLTGSQMRFSLGFASHLADDKRGLASALELPPAALQKHLTPDEGWRPLRVEVTGPIHPQQVNFLLRTLQDHQRRGDFNLLFVHLRSAGGNVVQSLRLAQGIAALGPKVHSVAYVDSAARGDAALIALACDELLVGPDAVLGGPGERSPTADELAALREPLQALSRQNDRDWSLGLALVDPDVEVFRCTRAVGGEARYLTADELLQLDDADQWQRAPQPLETRAGISGSVAVEIGAARAAVANFDEVKNLFQIDEEIKPLRPNWALAVVEWLADPRIAGVLLFVAWFALMFEMSTPGVGLPGFISALCFLLYFWSQFLHGTAGWLEIVLFAGGLACLGIELFILPGFGVFGAGGAIMVIASIVLASQTFVIPTNAYQLRQFPVSLLMVAAGLAGGIAAIAAVRRLLPNTPYFNRLILQPPAAEERQELARREALAAWDHLLHKRGVTTTPLVPAGKAQFGDELVDVISDGELLAKGEAVVVAQVAGSRVLVKRAPS